MSNSALDVTKKCLGAAPLLDNTQDWIYELDNPYLHGAYAPTTEEIAVDELEVIGELLMIKAQLMEYGSLNVVNGYPSFYTRISNLIGFTVNSTFFDTSSCHPHGEGIPLMVSTWSILNP